MIETNEETTMIRIKQTSPACFTIYHAEHGAWTECFETRSAATTFVRSQGYQLTDITN